MKYLQVSRLYLRHLKGTPEMIGKTKTRTPEGILASDTYSDSKLLTQPNSEPDKYKTSN